MQKFFDALKLTVLLLGLFFSSCSKEACMLCGEEDSALSMNKGTIMGQEGYVCDDCYKQLSGE